jgi:hypothetical protein
MRRSEPRRRRYAGIGAALAVVITAVATALSVFLTAAPGASAAVLTEVTAFGANPGGLRMYLYLSIVSISGPPGAGTRRRSTGMTWSGTPTGATPGPGRA